MEIFGPVHTRRFGLSLGINQLPPKMCSYNCVYCQLGRTNYLSIEPAAFSQPDEVYQKAKARLAELDTPPDYLTFVANGEPSLDNHLAATIELLKFLKVKVAIISNASLLWRADVRGGFMQADAVSLKVDSVDKDEWHRINRAHGRLQLEKILEGISEFAHSYHGRILTETMLVSGLNTSPAGLRATAKFIAGIDPEIAYLAQPLRSPAEDWVEAPIQDEMERASRIFMEYFSRTAIMADLPESDLSTSDDPLRVLLNTLKVHPMPQADILTYLRENHLPETTLEELESQKLIISSSYRGKKFYKACYNSENKDAQPT